MTSLNSLRNPFMGHPHQSSGSQQPRPDPKLSQGSCAGGKSARRVRGAAEAGVLGICYAPHTGAGRNSLGSKRSDANSHLSRTFHWQGAASRWWTPALVTGEDARYNQKQLGDGPLCFPVQAPARCGYIFRQTVPSTPRP
ncbi:hypothetical protein E2C01_068758 [Portunus trituberculatus]|uniref:Uncharacterized protein n=1 Tax=Portunus trituberculatus TaxID=210409 RepID=A0A5B7HN87_PORTR|nr:hypothetical protein [Portunus trituberculatus]